MSKRRKRQVRRNRKSKNNGAGTAVIAVILLIFAIFWAIGKGYGWDVFLICCLIISPFALMGYVQYKRDQKIKAALILAGSNNPMSLSPERYEQFCAELLKNNGWDAKTTVASGDYGADVIAVKGRRKIILQCKRWKGTVGVKAVQEAHTAISYYQADAAFVVSTSTYTPAAKKLAKSTGVGLLSHVNLIDMV